MSKPKTRSTRPSKKNTPARPAASKATTIETTVQPTPPVATATSIRKTINTLLAEGKSTKEITTVIQANFPGSAAAAKPSKHIAHYRCLAKRAGKQTAAA